MILHFAFHMVPAVSRTKRQGPWYFLVDDDHKKAQNKNAAVAQATNDPTSRATFVLGVEDHDASVTTLGRVHG